MGGTPTKLSFRVRYCETDQMGVVNHARFLDWFSEGRVEWLRIRGYSYKDWEQNGLALPVIKLDVQYRKAARFDEILDLSVSCVEFTPKKISFSYELYREEDLLASARTTHFFLKNGSVRAIEDRLFRNIQAKI